MFYFIFIISIVSIIFRPIDLKSNSSLKNKKGVQISTFPEHKVINDHINC